MALQQHQSRSSSSSPSPHEEIDGENSFYCKRLVLFECDYETELVSLLDKEKQQIHLTNPKDFHSPISSLVRCEAVEWILRVNAHHCFSFLTAILAIHYFDKFISSPHFQGVEKPWLTHLVALTCIFLAAKMEETQVPLLLDFQVEKTEYIFEKKTVQRMELLVLSALQWKMNPVTPLSFLEHIIKRIGPRHLDTDLLRRGQLHLMFIAADIRYARYPPSVLAAATMMHVMEEEEEEEKGCQRAEYQNRLMGLLKNISMEDVNECYEQVIKKPQTEALTRPRENKRRNGCEWCRRRNMWAFGLESSPVLKANKRIRARGRDSPR